MILCLQCRCSRSELGALSRKAGGSVIRMVLLSLCLFVLSAGTARAAEGLHPGMNTVSIPESAKGGRNISVDIYVPSAAKIEGDVLVLPGWKFSRARWHRETDLIAYADRCGFRLVFPEMSVSSYESAYFPETTMKWAATPGGEWVRSVLLPDLRRKYGLFGADGKSFLLGLSTGARGVLLVALQNPGVFSGGAALSGDCDQSLMPKDNLMTALYGPYSLNKARWEAVDNPRREILQGNWRMPLYIGHGRKDAVSPFEQSRLLYETIRSKNPGLKCVFSAPDGAGHTFDYWRSEVPAVMDFFAAIAKER